MSAPPSLRPVAGTGRARRVRGFTLVELLVVIAIIGVLAGLLLLALARAKATTRQAECLTRMKQWALALIAYTQDSEDLMPREGYHANGLTFWNNWAQVQDQRSKDVWYNVLAPAYAGVRPAASYAPPIERLAFYQRASLFHCPAAKFPKAAASPAHQIALFSIAMNSQLIEPPYVPTTSFLRITRPSDTVLFLDNLLEDEPRVVTQQAWSNLGQPAAMATRFAGVRHPRGGNLAFADGHAESKPGNQVVATTGPTRGFCILPEVNVVWHLDPP